MGMRRLDFPELLDSPMNAMDWLGGGGQMSELLEEPKGYINVSPTGTVDENDSVRIVAKQEKEAEKPKEKKVSKRKKKGKKSLRRVRVDNARRRGK